MTAADDQTKADYVRAEAAKGQPRDHSCHWPGCPKQVPPAMWGCREHWFALPKEIRARIWAAYRPGQEVDMHPSAEYLAAALAAQQWILKHGGKPRRPRATKPADERTRESAGSKD